MAEQQKNGLEEALETGASAAHLTRGALKAGKAVSGAAKGAAAGGPYGAVVGALWEGRKSIGKFVAAAAVLLLLPVLFVLMLPGLLFDGFSSAFSPADPETPILNSENALIENANTITYTISTILGEGMEDVMTRIERDFAASDGDGMEVINPYELGPYTMPTCLSPSTARQRKKTLRRSPLRIWRLSCAGGNPISTPTGGRKKSVKRPWRTRRPGKRPPYRRNG